ncbi:MAG TPA: copper resistance protein NlpE N-terminal domain-containing protein [Verrucomicrobiae bacterium]|nr:copper resistance protein NlpE N-terminal domain-containing protein [Verrucomicrobiae bacterium]
MHLRPFLALTLLLLLALSLPVPALIAQSPSAPPISVPATFSGTSPCADCPAIHESLTFFPGGLYLDRLVYEGRNTTAEFLGHWAFSDDGSLLTLLSGSAAGSYVILDGDHIRKFPPAGSNIPASYLPTFTRAGTPTIPTPAFSIRGQYVSNGPDSTLTQCDTEISLPVSSEGDVATLNQAYSTANLKPPASLLVAVKGRIVLEKKSGDSPTPAVEITHVDGSWRSQCAMPGAHLSSRALSSPARWLASIRSAAPIKSVEMFAHGGN